MSFSTYSITLTLWMYQYESHTHTCSECQQCASTLVNLENSPEERKTLAFKVIVADRSQPSNSAPPLFRDCSSKHIARDASKLSLCCYFFSHAYSAIKFCKLLFLRDTFTSVLVFVAS